MSERIDHEAEANRILRDVLGSDIRVSEAAYAGAQVHATLALVEQQRIANIIAWTTVNGSELSVHAILEIEEGLGWT